MGSEQTDRKEKPRVSNALFIACVLSLIAIGMGLTLIGYYIGPGKDEIETVEFMLIVLTLMSNTLLSSLIGGKIYRAANIPAPE